MPLYEYQCDACAQRFEVIQKFSDAAPDACRKCGQGPVRRLHSSPAIQFKGSGWYVTDYATKSKNDSSTGADAPSSTGETKAADSSQKSESTAKPDAPTPTAPSTATKD
jgi:putative FmdB family regulatory protein